MLPWKRKKPQPEAVAENPSDARVIELLRRLRADDKVPRQILSDRQIGEVAGELGNVLERSGDVRQFAGYVTERFGIPASMVGYLIGTTTAVLYPERIEQVRRR